MTRDQIVAEAARRLGDESVPFKAQVSAAFDFVILDLAAHEVLDRLTNVIVNQQTVLDQRAYSASSLTAQVSPDFPYEVLSLRVWAWGTGALLRRVTDVEYESRRALDGEDFRGRPNIWRAYPNMRTIELHPPADGENAGEDIEVLYTFPPTAIGGSTQITNVRPEDVETIVYGLKARLAQFLDETVADPATDWQLYIQGRARMWGRRHNNRVGTVEPYTS